MLLKQVHIEITTADNDGKNALSVAAQICNNTIFDIILASYDMMGLPPNGDSTQFVIGALTKRKPEFLRSLQRSRCTYNINQRFCRDWTALVHAANEGLIDVPERLLEFHDIDVKVADSHNSTALLVAAESGYVEIVEMILERYDQAEEIQDMDGCGDTLLTLGCESGKTRIMELALKRGGHNVNHRGKFGQTGSILAAEYGHGEVVDMLLKQDGIDVNIGDGQGRTSFAVAKGRGDYHIIAMLEPRMNKAG